MELRLGFFFAGCLLFLTTIGMQFEVNLTSNCDQYHSTSPLQIKIAAFASVQDCLPILLNTRHPLQNDRL